jgi:predicted nucleic acid-binding protein
MTRFLVDSSALARCEVPAVAARLNPLVLAGVVVSCGVVELQLLGSVVGQRAYMQLRELRRMAFGMLDTTEADFVRAREVQGVLVGKGQVGVRWPALLVAAVAERHGVTLLHCDGRYDLISGVTGQGCEWVVG